MRVSLETTEPKVAKRLRKTVDSRCGAAGPIDEDMPTSIVEILRDMEPKPASMSVPEAAHTPPTRSAFSC